MATKYGRAKTILEAFGDKTFTDAEVRQYGVLYATHYESSVAELFPGVAINDLTDEQLAHFFLQNDKQDKRAILAAAVEKVAKAQVQATIDEAKASAEAMVSDEILAE